MPSSTLLHNPLALANAKLALTLAQLRTTPDAHRHAGISR